MSDLFKKLNVLIKANLSDIGDNASARIRLGKNVDGEISALRERINDAVQYEEQIKVNVQQLQDEAARWDQQADEAVARGDEANARYAVEYLQRAQQRVTMAEADLREHQRVTQDLIARVNQLDAVVADARRANTSDAPAQAPVDATRAPDLSNVLRETREKIASMTDLAASQQEIQPSASAPEPSDEQAVDADLESRRQRLSKR